MTASWRTAISTRVMGRIRRRDAVGSALIVGLVVAIAPSVSVLIRENAVARAEQRLESQSRQLEDRELDVADPSLSQTTAPAIDYAADHTGDASYPARARVADALYIARQAQMSKSPIEQKAGLDRALHELQIAQGERPYWGEAKTVAGFVHASRDGEDAAVTRRTVAQSYADAPYLRYAAAWRVQYGLRHWEQFEPVTRHQIINEAVWLTRLDARSRELVFAMARDSAAYKPFVLSALAARVNDADFQPNEGVAP